MAKKWNVCYEVGSTGRIVKDASSPHIRSKAIEIAKQMSDRQSANGKKPWHIWVENLATQEVIWDNTLVTPEVPEGKSIDRIKSAIICGIKPDVTITAELDELIQGIAEVWEMDSSKARKIERALIKYLNKE